MGLRLGFDGITSYRAGSFGHSVGHGQWVEKGEDQGRATCEERRNRLYFLGGPRVPAHWTRSSALGLVPRVRMVAGFSFHKSRTACAFRTSSGKGSEGNWLEATFNVVPANYLQRRNRLTTLQRRPSPLLDMSLEAKTETFIG